MAEGGPADRELLYHEKDTRPLTQPGKRQRNETSSYCGFCWTETASVMAVCQGCTLRFCLKCSGLAEETYKLLADGKLDGFVWTCRSCKSTLPTLKNITETLHEIKVLHEDRMGNLESKVNNIETEITGKVTANIKEMKTEIANELKSSVVKLVDERSKEIEERRRREPNLIFFNIPETVEDKKKDEEDIRTIARELGIETLEMSGSFRLGKTAPNKIRPIKVILANRSQKRYLLDNAKHITKKVSSRLIKAVIVKDLTMEQRNERRLKRQARVAEDQNMDHAPTEEPSSPSLITSRPNIFHTGIAAQSTPRRLPHLNQLAESQSNQGDETLLADITVIGGIPSQQYRQQPISPEVERR
ncbi:MAG: hypothetical protein ABW168_25270 [Sedimenticola sp.]